MADKIRVLHLITRLNNGGAEKTTENTIRALKGSSRNYDVRLGVGAGYDSDQLSKIESWGVDTQIFPLIRHYNPFTAVPAVLQVMRHLRRNDIDIIHTHSTEAGVIGRLAGWLAGTPVIIHEIHGDPVAVDRNSALNKFVIVAERICAKVSTRLIAKSSKIKQDYLSRDIGTEEQYRIIYHGVDLGEYGAHENTNIFNDDKTTMLYVGRLTNGKGLYDLLDAMSQLKNSEIQLLIAGDGSETAELKEYARNLGLDDSVSFLGYREDIPKLMTAADALVLPSYREGTPRVITEALASGTPVISTRIAGIPEQVADGETGVLLEPGDIGELVQSMKDVAENPGRWEQMGHRAPSTVSKFSLDTATNSFLELYEDVLSELSFKSSQNASD